MDFEPVRVKMGRFWLVWFFCLTVVFFVLTAAESIRAEEGRVEYVKAGSGYRFSASDVSGEVLVWSESVNGKQRACFFILGSKNEAKVLDGETVLPNKEAVKVDDGIVVYRDRSRNKLYYKDLLSGEKGVVSEGYIGSFYQISGGKAVYLKNDSLVKDCYVQDIRGRTEVFLFSGNVRDLRFYNKDGFSFLAWLNNDDGILYFMDLSDKVVRKVPGAFPEMAGISLFKGTAVYIEKGTNKLFRVKLGETPEVKDLGIKGADPLFLYEDWVYYRNGDDLDRFNVLNGEAPEQVLTDISPIYFATNGEDFFWVDEGGLAWYAGMERLEVFPEEVRLEVDGEFEIGANAIYKNGWIEDVKGKAVWTTNGAEVVEVENGFLRALGIGEAVVEVEYEGMKGYTSVLVDGMTGLSMEPGGEILTKKGESWPVKVKAFYYAGREAEVTDDVEWRSILGNKVKNKIYCAEFSGKDVLTAVYGGFSVSTVIKIEEVAEGTDGEEDAEDTENEDPGDNENPGDEQNGDVGKIGDEADGNNKDENDEDVVSDEDSGNENSGKEEEDDEGLNSGGVGSESGGWEINRNNRRENVVDVFKEGGDGSKGEYVLPFGEKVYLVWGETDLKKMKCRALKLKSDLFCVEIAGVDKVSEIIKSLKIAAEMAKLGDEFCSPYYKLQPVSDFWKIEIAGEGIDEAFKKGLKILVKVPKGETGEKKAEAGFYIKRDKVWEYAGRAGNEKDFWSFNYKSVGVYGVFVPEVNFVDIRNHWARDDIIFLGMRHIIVGKTRGFFMPDEEISRAEMAALLVRLADNCNNKVKYGKSREKVFPENKFADVEKDAWYYPYVMEAKANGWIKGKGDGGFYPGDKITREEMAVIINNFLGMKKDKQMGNEMALGEIRENISPWAKEAVSNMEHLGIMQGRSDGEFAPKDFVTRAEAASALKRLYDLVGQED
ncbi:S-layer homology domain-containing protein [Thermosyntropha sp.]|uniref:S-layer homology domain-containing protein n=1 Tax=Thermosyntropha sp. TaxID=2740820 RepID=UPI0025F571B2|nr:S-layer homology domain-containing protein [Thermosyntropha sp.]MBO8159053.1 S-layer homology domain-containing protein [Thermosyntropha sp.]